MKGCRCTQSALSCGHTLQRRVSALSTPPAETPHPLCLACIGARECTGPSNHSPILLEHVYRAYACKTRRSLVSFSTQNIHFDLFVRTRCKSVLWQTYLSGLHNISYKHRFLLTCEMLWLLQHICEERLGIHNCFAFLEFEGSRRFTFSASVISLRRLLIGELFSMGHFLRCHRPNLDEVSMV